MKRHSNSETIKICGITTRPETARVMLSSFYYVSGFNYEPFIICQPSESFSRGLGPEIKYIPVKMNRGAVNILEVIKSISALCRIFRKERFTVVQYASSNAGLYAAVAGWLTKVPVRIFCQWGIPYTDYSGMKRLFFKFMEKLTCTLSTSVQPDSLLNLEWAIKEGLYPRKKGHVLGKGSAQGVNLSRFAIGKKDAWRLSIRNQFGIPDSATVFCFMGRIVPQKGVNELLGAFLKLNKKDAYLLIVGSPDEVDLLDQKLLNEAKLTNYIIFTGGVSDPERFHGGADFFVLPSYREGFPNTILEAGALGIPSIVTNINGMIDLVKDGQTGFICELYSTDSLYSAMNRAYEMSADEYKRMSEQVFDVVKNDFDSNYVNRCFKRNRDELVENSVG